MLGKFEILGTEIKKYEGDDEEIIIPSSITSLGDFAFSNASHLKRVILHENIDSIGSYCFYNCDLLEEINLLDSIRYIGGGAFSSCHSLKQIKLPKYLRNINHSLFYKDDQLENVIIQDLVKTIDHDAFAYCKSLRRIQFPASLTTILDSAFEECDGLTKVVLPDSVTKLGKKVFFHCLNLHELELSNALKEVDEGAFQSHSFIQITAKNDLLFTSKMFDQNWNFDWGYSFKLKNGENYQLTHSYFPCLQLKMFKPAARIIMLVNFLETYPRHLHHEEYSFYLEENKVQVIEWMVKNQRFDGLNQALDHGIILPLELEPYLDLIHDREEKAKLLAYQKNQKNSIIDDLFDDLFDD